MIFRIRGMSGHTILEVAFPEPLKSGVYCIRNKATKDSYIGSSCNIKQRLKQHKVDLRAGKHHSHRLQNAWNKWGESYFEFFPVGYYKSDEIRAVEQEWLDNSTCAYNMSRSSVHSGKVGEKYLVGGEWLTVQQLSERYSISVNSIRARMRYGYTGDDIIKVRPAPVYTLDGVTDTLSGWAKRIGVGKSTLLRRIKSGWNLRDVFTSEKVSSRKGLSAPNAKMITFNGVTDTMKGWAHRIDLPYTALAYRLGTGWSIEKALTTESKKRV